MPFTNKNKTWENYAHTYLSVATKIRIRENFPSKIFYWWKNPDLQYYPVLVYTPAWANFQALLKVQNCYTKICLVTFLLKKKLSAKMDTLHFMYHLSGGFPMIFRPQKTTDTCHLGRQNMLKMYVKIQNVPP